MVQSIEEFIKDSSTENNGSGSNIERWYSGEDQQTKLNLSVKAGMEQSPDQSARIIKAQAATGLAPDLVERNIDQIDSNIKQSSIDVDSLNKYNPVVSKWLSDNPHHASVAQDDIENLRNIENSVQDYSMLKSMYLSLAKGSASAMSSISRIPATIYDVAAIPQNLAAKFANRPDLMVKSPEWLLNNPVAKFFDKESNSYQIPDLERSIVSEIKNGNYARAGRSLAVQFVANAPQQAAIIAGALSGQSVAALVGAGVTTAAGVNKESRDAGADPLQSASNAFLQGTIESAFESLGTLGVLKHWENKIAESYGKQVARQVYVDFAKTIGYSFAAEGNEEFLTQMAQDFSDFITGVNPNAMQGTIERSLNAGIIGGVSGGLMTAPAAMASGVQRGQDIRQSTLTRDFYLSLGNSVEASKLRERLPEATKTLVERMTKDSSVENVYIPVDKFDKYFQDANIDPVSEMQKLGSAKAYDEAKQTGADVKIPLSTWVDNFVGTDHYKALANDVKFSPDDLSINQHAEIKKQIQEMDARQQTGSQPQQADSSTEIGSNIKEQLKAAGFDDSTSESYSKLVQSTFKNLGERAGIDPVELFNRYGLKVERTGQENVAKSELVNKTDAGKKNTDPLFEEAKKFSSALEFFLSKTEEERKKLIPVFNEIANKIFDKYSEFPDNKKESLKIIKKRDEEVKKAFKEFNDKNFKLLGFDRFQEIWNKANNVFKQGSKDYINNKTPEFKKWFSDSKVVDDQGEPLVVYHGTPDIRHIKNEGIFKTTAEQHLRILTDEGKKSALKERAYYFTDSIKTAKSYSELKPAFDYINADRGIVPVFLSMKNPMIVDWNNQTWRGSGGIDKVISVAQDKGYDGVIIKNVKDLYEGNEKILNGSTNYVVFSSNQIKSATENSGSFDPINPNIFMQSSLEDARGQLRFGGDRQFNIDLLKNADLSTFLHEMGHFNLEVFADLAVSENAPQQIKDDFSTLLKWFNVDSRDKIGKDQHEQFARGFEAYLMEGKAPSTELQSVFSRFRAWLISIYRDIRNLNVQLTPEVRSVMDRLLASDEEIKAVESQQNIQPLFSDTASFGMSESEAAKYSDAISQARMSAEQELAAKLIQDVTRERTKWWNEEKDKVRTEVESEVAQIPEYRALDILQGKKIGDIEPFKLSKKYIVEDFPDFALSSFPKPYIYSKEGGLHPDVAAEILGFNSGHEMLFKLETAEPRKSLVNRMTEERMRERHGDFLTDGRLPEEALRAVHNEKRSELLRKELEYLASEKIAVLKGLVRRISSPIPTIQAVRIQAEQIIASKKIRDISPSLYMRAEAKASKSAVEALLKGDVELAFAEKQKELFNHELYRSAVAAREDVDSIVSYLSKFNKESTREKLAKAGADYLEQIDSILERFDLRKSISLKAIDKKKSLLSWVQEQNKNGLTVDIPQNILDDAFAQHYKDATFETLQGVRDSVKTIEHLARVKNQLLASARAKELEIARDEITSEISAYFNTEKEPVEIAPGLKDRIIDGLKKNIADHTRMEFLFEHLGGNNPHGVVWEYFFKPVADAENVENEMRRKNADALNNIFGAYSKKERAEWFTKRFFIPEISTNSTTGNLTKANMLAVALNWGNQYNREALMEGYGWSDAQVNSILNRLDERDWKTVQFVWDHIESYWPAIAEQEKQLNGIAPQKVEAAEVVTRHGTFRGGYYPIVFDPKQSWRQSVIEEKNTVQEMFGGNWAQAMTRHGHTKERVGTGGKPLLLELSGLSNHISAVIHDLAFRPTIVDLNRLANDPIIRSSIASAAGRHMAKQLNPWLHAIAGDRPVEPMNAMEGLLGKARNGATVVALGLKLTSAMAQTLGYTIASKELGIKYAAQGMKDAYLNPTQISKKWEFITERSKMMRDRISNYDRDIRDFSRAPGLTPGTSAWFVFVGYMDLAMSIPAWLGAYSKAMDGRLANVQKGDENSAVDYADSVVRMTQAAGSAKDLASVQRGGQAWKLFTMFYSSMSVQFNQFQKVAQEYSLNKDVPRLLGSLSLLWFIPAVLEEIIRGRGPDDEDKAGWVLRKELLYPLQTVVLIRDLANALDRYIETGKKDFDGSPVFSIGESALGTAGLIGSALSSRDATRSEVRDATMMTGYVTQLPARQIWQTGEFIYDWMTGRKTPTSLQGVLSGLIVGNKK